MRFALEASAAQHAAATEAEAYARTRDDQVAEALRDHVALADAALGAMPDQGQAGESRRLVSYMGISNIRDLDGKNLDVRIEFQPTRYVDSDP